MKKNVKRILSALASLALCVSVLVSGSVAVAAEQSTEDSSFGFHATYDEMGYLKAREKEDSTPCYMYYTVGKQPAIRITAYGSKSKTLSIPSLYNGTFYDGLVRDYLYVKRNVKTSIHTLIYENRYPYATIGIYALPGASTGDDISGKWSPDSTRTYTTATTSF